MKKSELVAMIGAIPLDEQDLFWAELATEVLESFGMKLQELKVSIGQFMDKLEQHGGAKPEREITVARLVPAPGVTQKRRGRPPKAKADVASAEAPKRRGRPPKAKGQEVVSVEPKKRGRPKKEAPPVIDMKGMKIDTEIRALLRKSGEPMAARELAERIKYDPKLVSTRIRNMVACGTVQQEGQKRGAKYTLAPVHVTEEKAE